ncbi:hypothetical protein DEJ06_05870 [Curtobacterium sp. MCLR17_051]|nr:hypothetical protein DEJ07_00560 [Curtobacterium sp. MCLR17_053]PZF52678.1 hypothetical protein DEJ06_05870 [Curtobacterium sp. MCLR17_051]
MAELREELSDLYAVVMSDVVESGGLRRNKSARAWDRELDWVTDSPRKGRAMKLRCWGHVWGCSLPCVMRMICVPR